MKKNEIVTIYLGFVDASGGKRRPALIRDFDGAVIDVFVITSQYSKKSPRIKRQYFELIEWKELGLNKPSWIDIGTIHRLPTAKIQVKEIAPLPLATLQRLNDFIEAFNKAKEN